MQTEAFGRK